ncbi:MAG: hypothetical protein ABR529_15810 [Actinomycetota bacterium]
MEEQQTEIIHEAELIVAESRMPAALLTPPANTRADITNYWRRFAEKLEEAPGD